MEPKIQITNSEVKQAECENKYFSEFTHTCVDVEFK